jgi:CheY-like chemotaxis protein
VNDVVDLVTGLAWPVVVGVVLWRLYPSIRRVIESRGFTVKVGGAEITVQQASEQIGERLDDLREQVSILKAQVEGGAATEETAASPIATGVPQLRRVLWVDDYPQNNAYEVASLERKGVDVTQVKSLSDALERLGDQGDIDVVVTDMGRVEDGAFRQDAGIQLIKALRDQGIDTPIVVYTSAPTLARTRDAALASGARYVTASATELLEMLGQLGLG